jgi:hypothetical protein
MKCGTKGTDLEVITGQDILQRLVSTSSAVKEV